MTVIVGSVAPVTAGESVIAQSVSRRDRRGGQGARGTMPCRTLAMVTAAFVLGNDSAKLQLVATLERDRMHPAT